MSDHIDMIEAIREVNAETFSRDRTMRAAAQYHLSKELGGVGMSENKMVSLEDAWMVMGLDGGEAIDGNSCLSHIHADEGKAADRAKQWARDGCTVFIFRAVRKFVCPVDVTDVELLDDDPDNKP